jgi:hypothetical protein
MWGMRYLKTNNIMYKIVGADGRVYGPVSAEQIRQWIGEGRANAQTQALAAGAAAWQPLSLQPEFAHHFVAQAPPLAGPIPPLATPGPRKMNGCALAGLLFGILSLFCCCCGIFPSVPGIVFSVLGLSQINANPHLYEGRAMAILGLIFSILGFAIWLIWILVSIANGNVHSYSSFQQFIPNSQ